MPRRSEGPLNAAAPLGSGRGDTSLPWSVKAGFGLGDHSLNFTFSALSLLYLYFLTEVAGLRPGLAAFVLLVARTIDAFTDPAMGRLSDLTRWRGERRRPYFLLGALPYGLTFALLWQDLPFDGQMTRFAAYSAAYVLHTCFSTMLGVPYIALLPEMALGYQERTSMNSFRAAGSVVGTLLAAVALRPLVDLFGGGALGFAWAGLLAGIWAALPWLIVHHATWERPDFARPVRMGFFAGARRAAAHGTYRRLVALFLAARIAVDLVAALLIFYVTYWLRHADDFPTILGCLLIAAVASLPFWLWVSRFTDKATIFIFGACWWIVAQLMLLLPQPSWPAWTMFALAIATGFGYAVADMMPWSMLGDVIDEDDLVTGERREGIYSGFFTFLRKLGGATAVALAGVVLDFAGLARGPEQPASALLAIRILTAAVPAFFLAIAAAVAWSYPLTRERHATILQRLQARNRSPVPPMSQGLS